MLQGCTIVVICWPASSRPPRAIVRVTVMTLRKRLGEPRVIETVVGAGYRL